MTLKQHFDLVALLDLTLTFAWRRVHTYMLRPSSLGKSHGRVWVSSCYKSVSVADKAKSDDFDICPDLDLTVTV